MQQFVGLITTKTGISLYLLIPLVGGILWLSELHARVDNIESTVKIMQPREIKFEQEVIDRLARIETKIENSR